MKNIGETITKTQERRTGEERVEHSQVRRRYGRSAGLDRNRSLDRLCRLFTDQRLGRVQPRCRRPRALALANLKTRGGAQWWSDVQWGWPEASIDFINQAISDESGPPAITESTFYGADDDPASAGA